MIESLPRPRMIITHGGKAHRDELLAVACLLEEFGLIPVERRSPLEEELKDPSVLVVDIGTKYDPKLRNFDHHQFSAEENKCALSLLNEHYGWNLENEAWYEYTKVWDTQGPDAAFNSVNIPIYRIAVFSPFETWMLNEFGSYSVVPRNVTARLQDLGRALLSDNKLLPILLDRVKSTMERVDVDGLSVISHTHEDISRSHLYKRIMSLISYDLSISPSIDRDSGAWEGGWDIFRHAKVENKIDLSWLHQREEVVFAHNTGFLAVTKPMSLESVYSLIRMSIRR